MTVRREVPPGIERWALPVILVLAAALRVWGIGFGLPNLEARPDEMEVVPRALRLLSGDLNPHFFYYPGFYFYLLGGVFTLPAAWAVAGGTPLNEFLIGAALAPQKFILVGRMVTAAMGVATVYVAYRVGKRIHGPRTGLLAAGFLAVSHLHVRDSHFATTDVTLTLFILLSALFLLGVQASGRRKDYLWSGVFAGLAVSTKYVGLVMVGALIPTHLIYLLGRAERRGWRRLSARVFLCPGPWLFLLGAVVAFVITSPFALLDWAIFTSQFRFQLGHLAGGHGVDLGIGGVYHLLNTFPDALGWPLFVVGALGGIWAVLRHPKPALVLLAFPLLFYLGTFSGRTLFLRYMLPVIPFLCVTAAWILDEEILPRVEGSWVPVLAFLALAAAPLWDVAGTNQRLRRVDTRVQAAEWLEDAVDGETSTVYQTGERWGWLDLPLTSDSLETLLEAASRPSGRAGLNAARAYAEALARARLRESLKRGNGFKALSYNPVTGFGPGGPPDWIVLLESPLEYYSDVPEGLPLLLEVGYEEAVRFPASTSGRRGWYDQHDAFYLPFKGVRAVDRPGPDVTIFRRTPGPKPTLGTGSFLLGLWAPFHYLWVRPLTPLNPVGNPGRFCARQPGVP